MSKRITSKEEEMATTDHISVIEKDVRSSKPELIWIYGTSGAGKNYTADAVVDKIDESVMVDVDKLSSLKDGKWVTNVPSFVDHVQSVVNAQGLPLIVGTSDNVKDIWHALKFIDRKRVYLLVPEQGLYSDIMAAKASDDTIDPENQKAFRPAWLTKSTLSPSKFKDKMSADESKARGIFGSSMLVVANTPDGRPVTNGWHRSNKS